MKRKIFLSANWEYLTMLNYVVDAGILAPFIPPHTEADLYDGKALVSVVGFLFNNTKVMGLRWPGHINFEEVNLRYYIKHFDGEQWKRGVGFVSEIVPKRIIATTANLLYNEHYRTARMSHAISLENDLVRVRYNWQINNQDPAFMEVTARNMLQPVMAGSEEEFILEHYYGYNELGKSTTIEYAVEHPRWEVYPVTEYKLHCDIGKLYGSVFTPFIQNAAPHSVFLAKGSAVVVRKPVRIR